VEYSDLQTVCYLVQTNNLNLKLMQSVLQGNLFLTIRRVPEMGQLAEAFFCLETNSFENFEQKKPKKFYP
ncbi:hypothetical protein, partial [Parasutterella excrementihominis]|jgi:hypothetical protein|uniref:hypothetical protein n=1 Tax=Parasutterella excrementihominis TaxID=487175 RepID=UPI003AB553FB